MNMKQLKSHSLLHIGFIGGDMRQVYAYEYIKQKNFLVSAYSLSNGITSGSLPNILKDASVLVCGIPFSKDSQTLFLTSAPFQKNAPIDIDYFLSCLYHKKEKITNRFLFAGKLPKKVKDFCYSNHIYCHDFLDDENFAAANALPTAEGAIMEAIGLGTTVLENQKCLVLGYGRCGSILAKKLKALSADVTVYTRHPEQKEYFKQQGFHFYEGSLPYIAKTKENHSLSTYAYIFNTVPSLLLDSVTLSQLSSDTVIIDIASLPGGIDYNAVSSYPVHAKHTLGIPGKIAPKYAGELIAKTILSSIDETGL